MRAPTVIADRHMFPNPFAPQTPYPHFRVKWTHKRYGRVETSGAVHKNFSYCPGQDLYEVVINGLRNGLFYEVDCLLVVDPNPTAPNPARQVKLEKHVSGTPSIPPEILAKMTYAELAKAEKGEWA